tara:strand:+ start:127 stop:732 length:606 start_codon:yes stop_codon:yes gene_type:complete
MFFKNDQEIKLHKAAEEVSRFVVTAFMKKKWEIPEFDVDYNVINYNTDPNQIKLLRKKYTSDSELSEVLTINIPLIFKARSLTSGDEILSYFFPKDFKQLTTNDESRKKLTQKYIDVHRSMPQGFIYAVLAILHVEFGLRVDRLPQEYEKLAVLIEKTLFRCCHNMYLIHGTCDEDLIEDTQALKDGVIHSLMNFKQFYRF